MAAGDSAGYAGHRGTREHQDSRCCGCDTNWREPRYDDPVIGSYRSQGVHPPMASVGPWHRNARPSPDGEDQAVIYRVRASHLRALANAETDPILREQLVDLARQYDDIAASAVPARQTLGAMRRKVTGQRIIATPVAEDWRQPVQCRGGSRR
jgi:hypothetical protein